MKIEINKTQNLYKNQEKTPKSRKPEVTQKQAQKHQF